MFQSNVVTNYLNTGDIYCYYNNHSSICDRNIWYSWKQHCKNL